MVQSILWRMTARMLCVAVILVGLSVGLNGELQQTAHAATTWYVAPTGNNSNTCTSVGSACASIQGALGKPGFVAGDTIKVASGTYNGNVYVSADAVLSGGWASDFSAQNGMSILDGQDTQRVVQVPMAKTVTMERFTIQNGYPGEGSLGGGILNEGTLTLNDSVVAHNRSKSTSGGGIRNSGTLTLNRTSVRNNLAQDTGGSIVSGGGISNNGTLTANDSAITENTAGFGGGIGHQGTLVLNNTTISRNSSYGGVNAAGIASYGGTIELNSVTITENYGNAGLGVSGGVVTLRNTILAGNDPYGSQADCGSAILNNAITSQGYNLLDTLSNCQFTLATGDIQVADPKLNLLMNEPGYHALLANSPAINAGNPTGCAGSSGTLTADQRGVARNGRCDIGAYEATNAGAAAAFEMVQGSPQRSPRGMTFWKSVDVLVLDAAGTPVGGTNVTFTAPNSGASATFESTNTNVAVAATNAAGVASARPIANQTDGSYTVQATATGIGTPMSFALSNLGWYVGAGGNDANDCQSAATACATIQGALEHAGYQDGDTILAKTATITGTGTQVLLIDRNARLLGGWNNDFSAVTGRTTFDGQDARGGIKIAENIEAMLDHVIVENAYAACCTVTAAGIFNHGFLTLTNSILRDNHSESYGGGALYNQRVLKVVDTEFKDNSAAQGAGIYNNSGGVTLLRTQFLNNDAGSGGGGAFYNGGSVQATETIITGNTAAGGAGISNSGILVMDYSLIANNVGQSAGGGGIAGGAYVELTNTTISNNSASFGGGIAGVQGPLKLNNVTVSGNHAADSGGGISSASALMALHNTIVAGNTALNGPDCAGTLGSAGYNVLGSTKGCTLNATTGDIQNVFADLGALQDNGGPTHTMRARSANPAINHGDPSSCPATDQRGVARPEGTGCDIGAFELEATPNADLTVSIADAPDPAKFKGTLKYTIVVENNGPDTATGVAMRHTLPSQITYQAVSAPGGWTCTTPAIGASGLVECKTASMANGASANFLITTRTKASTKPRVQVASAAHVSADVYDAGSNPFEMTASTCVGQPKPTKQQTPSANATVNTRAVFLDWKDSICTATYQLYVAKDSINGQLIVQNKKLKVSEFTTPALKRKGTYWWRVMACNGKMCRETEWRKFTVAKNAQ